MEDLAVMPILSELFETLPKWDVPELTIEPNKPQFFRDGFQVVHVKNSIATRYHAEFVRPRRYERREIPGEIPGPAVTNMINFDDFVKDLPAGIVSKVTMPKAEVEKKFGMPPNSLSIDLTLCDELKLLDMIYGKIKPPGFDRDTIIANPLFQETLKGYRKMKKRHLIEEITRSPDGPIITLPANTNEGSCTRKTIHAVCTRDDDGIYLKCNACGWIKVLEDVNNVAIETIVKEADDHQYRDDQTEPVAVELPPYNIAPPVWGGLPRIRPATGGLWRDDDTLYYQLLNQPLHKYRPNFDGFGRIHTLAMDTLACGQTKTLTPQQLELIPLYVVGDEIPPDVRQYRSFDASVGYSIHELDVHGIWNTFRWESGEIPF